MIPPGTAGPQEGDGPPADGPDAAGDLAVRTPDRPGGEPDATGAGQNGAGGRGGTAVGAPAVGAPVGEGPVGEGPVGEGAARPGPPPPPAAPPVRPFFGEGWPGPAGPASPVVLGAAAASGLLAAWVIPQGPPGLGFLVLATGWAVLGTVVRRHARSGPQAPVVRRAALGWGALAVGFAAVAALRDAGWLIAVSLPAAALCGSLALAGPSFRLLPGAFAIVPATFRALPWAARGVGTAGRLGARTMAAVAACAALLAVFTPLLAGSDAAFARAVAAVLPAVDPGSAVRTAWLAAFGVVGLLGAAFLLVAPATPAAATAPSPPRLRTVEWALPLGGLVVLFGAFVAVQLGTLLGGDAYVRETTGVTYAEYARGGFWQLLAVSVLALGVILAGRRLAPPGRGRVLLAALALLTLAIVATATGRMWLYQEAYGFTVLRLVVLACEVWLGVAFVLVLVAVLRRGRPHGIVASGAVLLLALALLDPERFVADRAVDRFSATGMLDTEYLATLSADAAPALARLPEPERACALAQQAPLAEADWRSLNAARVAAAPLTSGAGCGRPQGLGTVRQAR